MLSPEIIVFIQLSVSKHLRVSPAGAATALFFGRENSKVMQKILPLQLNQNEATFKDKHSLNKTDITS